ncbi:unnamed protein product, partial [Iphiclides podalirius]
MEKDQRDRELGKDLVGDLKYLGLTLVRKDQEVVLVKDLKDLGLVLEEKDQAIIKEKDPKDRDQYPEAIMVQDQMDREPGKDLVVDHKDPGLVLVGKDQVEVVPVLGLLLKEKDRVEVMEKDHKVLGRDLGAMNLAVTTERELKVLGLVLEEKDQAVDHKEKDQVEIQEQGR